MTVRVNHDLIVKEITEWELGEMDRSGIEVI